MDQRSFWASEFGNEYIGRNNSEELMASNLEFFSKILRLTNEAPKDFLEFGANIGMNIRALKLLYPKSSFSSVEINAEACKQLREISDITFESSIEDFLPDKSYDVVFSKGVLIHIAPENLTLVYEKMYQASNKWILLAEYYNPTPVDIDYRGHKNKLFKRDFAGEILDRYPDLRLIDYGFCYHKGSFPQDDITWFLLKKESN
jgi:spore coat polysaccharide biosynthesis protein SpsF